MMIPVDNEQRNEFRQYRPFREDRVDDPWQKHPDVESYNATAYDVLEYEIEAFNHEPMRQSHGCVLLGEAGTGKTHILMRVVKRLSQKNHVMFVRRVNNEFTITQYIWASIVRSLVKPIPKVEFGGDCQFDRFLNHVFSGILLDQLFTKVQNGSESYRRILDKIKDEPERVPEIIRTSTYSATIRNMVLNALKDRFPEIDLDFISAFWKFYTIRDETRRRKIQAWLEGQLDDSESKDFDWLGLPAWIQNDDDPHYTELREEKAENAIHTLSLMAELYPDPLILCFDQLEGLKGRRNIIKRFTDIIREIFTRCNNFLIITAIFPSLWEDFNNSPYVDQSYLDRAGQTEINLEPLNEKHAFKIIESRLRQSGLSKMPQNAIFPFEIADIPVLLQKKDVGSEGKVYPIRQFIARCRDAWRNWVLGQVPEELIHEKPALRSQEESATAVDLSDAGSNEFSSQELDTHILEGPCSEKDAVRLDRDVTWVEIAQLLANTAEEYEQDLYNDVMAGVPNEEELFNELSNVLAFYINKLNDSLDTTRLNTAGKLSMRKVLPLNSLYSADHSDADPFCLAVLNKNGNKFTARMRNILGAKTEDLIGEVILVRDKRAGDFIDSGKGGEYCNQFSGKGILCLLSPEDRVRLQAIYTLLEDLRNLEHQIRNYTLSTDDLYRWLIASKYHLKINFFRKLRETSFGKILLDIDFPELKIPNITSDDGHHDDVKPPDRPAETHGEISHRYMLGSERLETERMGLIGKKPDDDRLVALNYEDPQAILLFGYMGSGKSYALGVMIENALLREPHVLKQADKPLTVIAFNYRKNRRARIEYPSYGYPNDDESAIYRLREDYGLDPTSIGKINFIAYEPELVKCRDEYGPHPGFPLKFRPMELQMEEWLILLKPPSRRSEYMNVLKDMLENCYYGDVLDIENLKIQVEATDRLNKGQKRRALNRIAFAEKFIDKDRGYEWDDLFKPGVLNVIDIRSPMIDREQALQLCIVSSNIAQRTTQEVNKLIVFDEAHEYMNNQSFIEELDTMLTQIRHNGISFILASQVPEHIPHRIFRFCNTRFLFKITNKASFKYLNREIPDLAGLTVSRLSDLPKAKGYCYLNTDAAVNDGRLKHGLFQFRPRMTRHGGETRRNLTETSAPQDHLPESGDMLKGEDEPAKSSLQPGEPLPQHDDSLEQHDSLKQHDDLLIQQTEPSSQDKTFKPVEPINTEKSEPGTQHLERCTGSAQADLDRTAPVKIELIKKLDEVHLSPTIFTLRNLYDYMRTQFNISEKFSEFKADPRSGIDQLAYENGRDGYTSLEWLISDNHNVISRRVWNALPEPKIDGYFADDDGHERRGLDCSVVKLSPILDQIKLIDWESLKGDFFKEYVNKKLRLNAYVIDIDKADESDDSVPTRRYVSDGAVFQI